MHRLDVPAAILTIVGGLNWGLVAVADFDLVAAVFGLEFGETNAASRLVYGAVALSALWLLARVPALVSGTRHRAAVTA
jgi:uncharacterized membrane protein YuzA (DUF378 family)